MTQILNWWDDQPPTLTHIHEISSSEDAPLVMRALRERTCMVTGKVRGKMKDGGEFHAALQSIGLYPYSKYSSNIRYAGRGEFLMWDHHSEVNTVEWTASSEGMGEKLAALLKEFLTPIPDVKKAPPVYGFSFEHGQYMVREIGRLDDKLVEDNYRPKVVCQYNRIVSELKKPDPAGRLILVEGEPGTGKTRMVRSLIGSLMETSKCIVVPPSLMDRLSGPEFTLCLIQQRVADTPLTLILEDADDCLIAREKNSAAKASLSALLNLSDGIMGATLDLRVVATTNQDLGSIDRAILRPGRLLERVHVGSLDARHAERVYTRLTGGHTIEYHGPPVLAQVYEDARAYQASESRQA